MSTHSVSSVQSTTRYWESQISLAVMLWLSRVVVNRTFTSGGVNVHARLFGDHRHVNVFICMLNYCGWSQLQNYFNSEIFPICTIKPAPSAPYKMTWRPKLVMILAVEHFWLPHSVCFWNVDTLLRDAHDHVWPLLDWSHTLRWFRTGLQGGNNDLLGWDMLFWNKVWSTDN